MAKKRGIQTHSFAPNPYYVKLPERIPGIFVALISVIFIVVAFVAFFAISVHAWTYQQPTENFDINTTSGTCTYQPLNNTWLDFDGITNSVSLGNNVSLSLNRYIGATICAYVKPAKLPVSANSWLFGKGQSSNYEYGTLLAPNGQICVYMFNLSGSDYANSCTSTYNQSNIGKTWVDVCMIYKNQTYLQVFVNGQYQETPDVTFNNVLGRGISPLTLATRSGGYFNGSIAGFKFYTTNINLMRVYKDYQDEFDVNTNPIPILMLHGYIPSQGYNGTDLFLNYSQMNTILNYINTTGWTTITDVDYYNYTLGKVNLPNKSIMLIFDDGYDDDLQDIAPLLKTYGFKGVAAISTSLIGSDTAFMTWKNVTDLIKIYNWSIASHSHTHCHLGSITGGSVYCNSSADIASNLSYSKWMIINNTGYSPITFVYPYNDWGATKGEQLALSNNCTLNYSICVTSASSATNYYKANFVNKYTNLTYGGVTRIEITNVTDEYTYIDSVLNDTYISPLVNLRLNEKSGATAYDSSGNGYNGTISGATWNTDGVNVTTQGYNVLLNLLGLNNSLVYYNNGSLAANALNGLLGLNFYNNATAYVLDNFNLTEGVSRQNTPLWFSYSSPGEKHIASNLTGTINATVVIDVTGITPKDVRYVSHSGLYTKTYGPGDYIYDAGAHTITLTVNGIEPATGSNVIYVDQVEDDDIGSSSDSRGSVTVSQPDIKKNPASVIAIYPSEWRIGSDVYVYIQALDYENISYISKNISFVLPKGIKLKSLQTNQSASTAIFSVLNSIHPGDYLISALVTGDRTVQKDIYISVVDSNMTVQTKSLEGNKKDVLTQNNKSLTYMVLGIAGFFFLIMVVALILAASKDNAKG